MDNTDDGSANWMRKTNKSATIERDFSGRYKLRKRVHIKQIRISYFINSGKETRGGTIVALIVS
jgi:hypothetical protein